MENPKNFGALKKISLLIGYFLEDLSSLRGRIFEYALKRELQKKGFSCHKTTQIVGKLSSECFECGSNVYLGVYSLLFVGNDFRGGAGTGKVKIGNDVYIGDHCNIRAAGGPIEIGSKVLLGNHVTVIAANHGYELGTPISDQPWNKSPLGVSIGNDCWIGAHVTLLPGSRVCDGAIVAAGAVVTGIVPEFEIWGGVPAKRIASRKKSEVSTEIEKTA